AMNTEPEQELPDPARDLLAATVRLLSEQQRGEQNRRSSSRVFSAARKKADRQYELELRRQLISSAGIDIEKMEEHQAHNRLTVREHVKRQARDAMAVAAEISKRHVVATAERVTRLQGLTQFGAQATDYDLLKVATSINSSLPGIFRTVPLRTALANVARLKVDMSGEGPFAGSDPPIYVNWHFSYVPRRTGLLNVVSSLLINGFVSVETDPMFLRLANARVWIGAFILVFQSHPTIVGVPVQDDMYFPAVLSDSIITPPG